MWSHNCFIYKNVDTDITCPKTPVEKQFGLMDTLGYIQKQILANQPLEAILDYTYSELTQKFPCDRFGIVFFDDKVENKMIHWVKAKYQPILLTTGHSENIEGTALKKTIVDRHVMVMNDLDEWVAKYPDKTMQTLVDEGIKAMLTFPIFVDNKPIAMLACSSRHVYAYTDNEIKMFVMIADAMSIAIDKAWRSAEWKRTKNLFSDSISRLCTTTQDQLKSIVETYSRILATLGEKLDEKQHLELQSLLFNSQHTYELLDNYQKLAILESDKIRFFIQKNVDFIDFVIEPAIAKIQPFADRKQVWIERNYTETDVKIDCDPELMTNAVYNMLDNAINYAYPFKMIVVNLVVSNNRLYFSVLNDGVGFANEHAKVAFQAFVSFDQKRAETYKNASGLGLYNVWRTIKLHGGNVSASTIQQLWAEFRFDVPMTFPFKG